MSHTINTKKHSQKAPSGFKKMTKRVRRAKEKQALKELLGGRNREIPVFKKSDTYDYL